MFEGRQGITAADRAEIGGAGHGSRGLGNEVRKKLDRAKKRAEERGEELPEKYRKLEEQYGEHGPSPMPATAARARITKATEVQQRPERIQRGEDAEDRAAERPREKGAQKGKGAGGPAAERPRGKGAQKGVQKGVQKGTQKGAQKGVQKGGGWRGAQRGNNFHRDNRGQHGRREEGVAAGRPRGEGDAAAERPRVIGPGLPDRDMRNRQENAVVDRPRERDDGGAQEGVHLVRREDVAAERPRVTRLGSLEEDMRDRRDDSAAGRPRQGARRQKSYSPEPKYSPELGRGRRRRSHSPGMRERMREDSVLGRVRLEPRNSRPDVRLGPRNSRLKSEDRERASSWRSGPGPRGRAPEDRKRVVREDSIRGRARLGSRESRPESGNRKRAARTSQPRNEQASSWRARPGPRGRANSSNWRPSLKKNISKERSQPKGRGSKRTRTFELEESEKKPQPGGREDKRTRTFELEESEEDGEMLSSSAESLPKSESKKSGPKKATSKKPASKRSESSSSSESKSKSRSGGGSGSSESESKSRSRSRSRSSGSESGGRSSSNKSLSSNAGFKKPKEVPVEDKDEVPKPQEEDGDKKEKDGSAVVEKDGDAVMGLAGGDAAVGSVGDSAIVESAGDNAVVEPVDSDAVVKPADSGAVEGPADGDAVMESADNDAVVGSGDGDVVMESADDGAVVRSTDDGAIVEPVDGGVVMGPAAVGKNEELGSPPQGGVGEESVIPLLNLKRQESGNKDMEGPPPEGGEKRQKQGVIPGSSVEIVPGVTLSVLKPALGSPPEGGVGGGYVKSYVKNCYGIDVDIISEEEARFCKAAGCMEWGVHVVEGRGFCLTHIYAETARVHRGKE